MEKKTITTLDKTQKMYFDMCLKKYTPFMLDEPTKDQQLKLIEFISEFNVLDQTQVITPSGKTLNDTEKFNLWWRQNLDEIIEIFFV
jgi:hypothetical protein